MHQIKMRAMNTDAPEKNTVVACRFTACNSGLDAAAGVPALAFGKCRATFIVLNCRRGTSPNRIRYAKFQRRFILKTMRTNEKEKNHWPIKAIRRPWRMEDKELTTNNITQGGLR
jgi:hypothetical protein